MPDTLPARAVLRFLDCLAERGVNMHGFHLAQHGQTVAEGYWQPFTRDTPHRMFSVGKSFTSLAIGLLMAEGRLRLTDRIVTFFPDKLPADVPPQISRMTLRDMLRMATAHRFTAFKRVQDDDWTRAFFTAPPTNEPGAVFAYDTSSTHTLAALVERLSGQSLLNFLRERLLQPLGCTGTVRWLTDPCGVCQGGSGLVMTLPDLARVARCCLLGGEGILPANYLREATARQIYTGLQAYREERFGYGYQFWRTRHNGYAMYGLGGQLAVCLPDEDLILCTMADTQLDPSGVETIYDALWSILLPAAREKGPPDVAAGEALQARLAALTMPPVAHEAQAGAWPCGRYVFADNMMGLTQASIRDDAVVLSHGAQETLLPYGVGAWHACAFGGTREPCLVSAGMQAEGRMRLSVQLIGDTPCGIDMQLVCSGDALTVQGRAAGEAMLAGFSGVASGRRA